MIKDERGKVEQKGTAVNSTEEFRQFLDPYKPGKAVLEATRNSGPIYDWLKETLDNMALAHPLKVFHALPCELHY